VNAGEQGTRTHARAHYSTRPLRVAVSIIQSKKRKGKKGKGKRPKELRAV